MVESWGDYDTHASGVSAGVLVGDGVLGCLRPPTPPAWGLRFWQVVESWGDYDTHASGVSAGVLVGDVALG